MALHLAVLYFDNGQITITKVITVLYFDNGWTTIAHDKSHHLLVRGWVSVMAGDGCVDCFGVL